MSKIQKSSLVNRYKCFYSPIRGALLLCPQKQCLSGKEDGLSGRTNQRLPCVKGAVTEGDGGIVFGIILILTIPPSRLHEPRQIVKQVQHQKTLRRVNATPSIF